MRLYTPPPSVDDLPPPPPAPLDVPEMPQSPVPSPPAPLAVVQQRQQRTSASSPPSVAPPPSLSIVTSSSSKKTAVPPPSPKPTRKQRKLHAHAMPALVREYHPQQSSRSIATTSTATHLLFEFRAFIASICAPGEFAELAFSLYNGSTREFLSEEYVLRLTFHGMPEDEERIGRVCSIFANVPASSSTTRVYLVCRLVRRGRMLVATDQSSSSSSSASLTSSEKSMVMRRPFGWAVVEISDALSSPPADAPLEKSLKIYTPLQESAFSSLMHEIIDQSGQYERSPRAEMVIVSVRRVNGAVEMDDFRQQHPEYRDWSVTPRLGFPDVILPGDDRNTLYLTLVAGEFSQGRKTTAKNIEITAEVRLGDGRTLPFAVDAGGSGERLTTYESMVQYHQNSPILNERVRIDIPYQMVDTRAHIYLMFRHVSSSNDKGEKSDRAFGFAVLPLTKHGQLTMLPNGEHHLVVFKWDKRHSQPDYYMSAIFDHEVEGGNSMDEVPQYDGQRLSPLAKDQFTVRTTLCSTRLTQDESLLNLLNWRQRSDMHAVLKNFTFIGPAEIIKYVEQILDALFGVLNDARKLADSQTPRLVFSALVFTLNIIISDRRFTNFKPILDVYMRNHFSRRADDVAAVWPHLMASMRALVEQARDPLAGKELRLAIKAWEYLFKFVVASWQAKSSSWSSSLPEDVRALFDSVHRVIIAPEGGAGDQRRSSSSAADSSSSAGLIGTQILVLQNLPSALHTIHEVGLLPTSELVGIVSRTVQAFGADKRKVVETKLQMCTQLADGPLFDGGDLDDEQHRRTLARVFCGEVSAGMASGQNDAQLDALAFRLVLSMCSAFDGVQPQFYRDYKCLADLAGTIVARQLTGGDASAELYDQFSFAVLGVWQLLGESGMAAWLSASPSSSALLQQSLDVMRCWFTERQSHWPESVSKEFHAIALHLLAASRTVLKQQHEVPGEQWMAVMSLIVAATVKPADDNDEFAAKLLGDVWSVAKHQLKAGVLSGGVLELLVEHRNGALREIALQVVMDVMHSSHGIQSTASGPQRPVTPLDRPLSESMQELTAAEVEFIETLDTLVMTEKRGDKAFHEQLVRELRVSLSSPVFSTFLVAVDKFLGLALSARKHGMSSTVDSVLVDGTSPSSPSPIDDNLTVLLSYLLHFTKLLDRAPIHIKYIYQLASIHLTQQHYGECAWTLNYHRDLLSWDRHAKVAPLDEAVQLAAVRGYLAKQPSAKSKGAVPVAYLQGLLKAEDLTALTSDEQSAFSRKELVTLLMIQLLTDACQFENALKLARELAQQYEHTTYDFDKLAKLHRVVADLLERSVHTARYYPEYFRVAFVGRGWENSEGSVINLAGKQMVYAGQPFEKLGEFVERTLAKYPGAELLTNTQWPPERSIEDSPKRWLQICGVDPVPHVDKHQALFNERNADIVPDALRQYYKRNSTCLFSYTKPFKRQDGAKSPPGNNEFSSLWVRKIVLRTENRFPHFLKCSEVEGVTMEETSPIENAIQSIQNKNRELQQLCRKFSGVVGVAAAPASRHRMSSSSHSVKSDTPALSNVNTSPLTMSLNGAIDAPVNGGLPAYRQAFLSADFVKRHPDASGHVRRLREVIADQTHVIAECLAVHGRVAPPEMRPLHQQLLLFFRKNFAAEIECLGIEI